MITDNRDCDCVYHSELIPRNYEILVKLIVW